MTVKKIYLAFKKYFQNFDSASWMQVLSVVVFIITLIVAVYFATQVQADREKDQNVFDVGNKNYYEQTQNKLQNCEFRSSLNGVCVETFNEVHTPVVAVMVENHVDANPLSGMAEASVVYEAPVEGGIPRFMALYPIDSDIKKVGPVRSARPYYLDWVKEFDTAMYMHVGGSPEALQKISSIGLFDMNEFYRGWYFWRDNSRYAPHNTYTSGELWKNAYERYRVSSTTVEHQAWEYLPAETCVEECVLSVQFSYGGGYYNPEWRFVSSTGQYERYQFNKKHRDTDGAPYVADTIAIQQVDAQVLDGVGRLGLDTIGEGNGWVLRDGYATKGIWKKESLSEKTRWFDETGEEIPLKAGKIWIQVVTQFNSFELN